MKQLKIELATICAKITMLKKTEAKLVLELRKQYDSNKEKIIPWEAGKATWNKKRPDTLSISQVYRRARKKK